MHMTLVVVGNGDIDEMMNPFWQDLEVEEFLVGDVPEYEKERFIEHYNEKTKGFHYSMEQFDELYAEHGEVWNFNSWRKDDDGVWREYSTSNPDMQWDWYEIGGRWPGRLQLKEGAVGLDGPHFSWGWTADEKKEFLSSHGRCCDVAYKGDVANLDTLTSYAVLINGEWIELSEGEKVADYLKDVTDDTILTCIDYHM